MCNEELKELLDAEARRINNTSFIDKDPVQFPRRFSKLKDIEATAILSATIAWGNRKMICRNADKMLKLMADDPAAFIEEGAFDSIPDDINIHRTFFGKNLKNWCRALQQIFHKYGSIEALAIRNRISSSEFPAWELAKALQKELVETNGACDSRCLPVNIDTSALKRLNMALRWFVRNDGIVDLGVWEVLRPSQLFMPMDVHVVQTSRELGLLQRKSTDAKAARELTDACRKFNPDDPVLYDYALFGIGMNL